MTKADLVETIYEKIGFSRKESAEIVDLVFDLMKETLESGQKIKTVTAAAGTMGQCPPECSCQNRNAEANATAPWPKLKIPEVL